MSEDDYIYAKGNPVDPVVPSVDDATVMRNDNDIIAIGHDRLEDCPAEGRFIEKSSLEKDLSLDTNIKNSPIDHSTLENSIEKINFK